MNLEFEEKRYSQFVADTTPSMGGGSHHKDRLSIVHVINVSSAVLSVPRVKDTPLCGDQAVCEDDHAPPSLQKIPY